MKEISIVIPILNESENIKLLVPEISKNIQKLKILKYEIILIDDNSEILIIDSYNKIIAILTENKIYIPIEPTFYIYDNWKKHLEEKKIMYSNDSRLHYKKKNCLLLNALSPLR